MADEVLISVDVEASGPSPSTGSLIAVGACLVDDPGVGFYTELKPLPGVPWSDEAERIHGLARGRLDASGLEPTEAMARFAAWLDKVRAGRYPVFVGFNATFDWMFVADYCHRFLGHNPFGTSGLDIKAYYMGRTGVERWAETARGLVATRFGIDTPPSHNALEDAREQALLMSRLLASTR
jgi:ribonuclease T